MRPVCVIAHRGASEDAPENTLRAFALAWEQGADAVECDVHLAKDGHLMVIHDAHTQRVSGKDAPVSGQTLEELRRLDVGSWKDKKWKGEKIPTLAELFASMPTEKKIYVEVKCGPEVIPEFRVAMNSTPTLGPERIVVISFNAAVIAAFKKELPLLTAFLLVGFEHDASGAWVIDAEDLLARAEDCHADGLALYACDGLTAALVKHIKDEGLDLFVWVVDDEPLALKMREIGIETIATNRPGWLRGIMG